MNNISLQAQSVFGPFTQLKFKIRRLKPGEIILWPTQYMPYRAAEEVGVKISTKKISGKGFEVRLRQ